MFVLVVAFCVSSQDKGKSEMILYIQEAAHMLNMKKIEELQNLDIKTGHKAHAAS